MEILAGTYSSGGRASCFSCKPGTYSAAKAKVCRIAPPGTYISGYGATGTTKIPAGYFSDKTGASSGTLYKCPPGTYSGLGQQSCTACAPGSFAKSSGSSSCTLCSKGYYNTGGGSVNTITTNVGDIVLEEDMTEDHFNEDGTPKYDVQTSSTKGATKCIAAAPGYYVDTVGATTPKPIPADYYGIASGQTSCCVKACVKPLRSNSGSTDCSKCEPGSYTPSGSPSVCLGCNQGWYNPTPTTPNKCVQAPVGWYVNPKDTTKKLMIPAGYYSALPGASNPTAFICKPGTYSVAGQYACTSCAIGKFGPDSGASVCTSAPAGTYASKTGLATTTVCSAGYSCPSTGMSANGPACPVGQYSFAGKTVCTPCKAGMFNKATAADECDACEGGYFSAIGASVCTQASPGYYVNPSSPGVQTPTPKGYYNPFKGQSKCCNLASPARYYIAAAGATVGTTSPCAAGSYQPKVAQTSCVTCPIGKFMPTKGATVCTSAPAGKFVESGGSTVTTSIPAGYYNGNKGASKPNTYPSPPGYYIAITGATIGTSTACATDSFSGIGAASACFQCSAGE